MKVKRRIRIQNIKNITGIRRDAMLTLNNDIHSVHLVRMQTLLDVSLYIYVYTLNINLHIAE